MRATMLAVWIGMLPILANHDENVSVPEVRYRLQYRAEPFPGVWQVTIEARDLPREGGPPTLWLEDWGQWTEVEGGYVTDLEGSTAVRRVEGTDRFELQQPEEWKGRLEVRYTIPIAPPGSKRQRDHGLLPQRIGETVAGFGHNTLMRVMQKGEPIDAQIAIELRAPQGTSIFTGWGGLSEGRQRVTLDGDPGQCPIVFGKDPYVARARDRGHEIEVVQFGRAKDVTGEVLTIARLFVLGTAKALESPFGKPVRIYITGEEPGGGGVRTDHALGLGFHPNVEPYYINTIAHEIHHEWLPGKVDQGESLVWFFEGFDDYFALWHLARLELVPRDWFAQRLLELEAEARSSEAFGQVRLDDPEISWRDGDGPRETLAYKGGAMLAFLLDAELRHRGQPGLVRLMRHLIERGRYSREILRDWLAEHDSADLWDRWVAGSEVWPEIEPILHRSGFWSNLEETPTRLTYLGIETDDATLPSRVTALDPQGPAAQAGLEIGDRVTGFAPMRWGSFRVPKDVESRYRFAMTWLDPDASTFSVEVERGGEGLQLPIEPVIRDGGFEQHRSSDAERIDDFFSVVDRSEPERKSKRDVD